MDSVNTFVLKDGTTIITNFIRTGPPNYDEWWMAKNTATEEVRVTDMSITIPPCTTTATFRPVPNFKFVGQHFTNLSWREVNAFSEKGRIEKIKMFQIAEGKTMFSSEADVYDMEPFFELSDGIIFGDLQAKKFEGWMSRKNSEVEKEREEFKNQIKLANQNLKAAQLKSNEIEKERDEFKNQIILANQNLQAAQLKSDDTISALKIQLAKANTVLAQKRGNSSSQILEPMDMDKIDQKISDIHEDLFYFRTLLSGQTPPIKSARVAPYETTKKEAEDVKVKQEQGSHSSVVRPQPGGGPSRRGGAGRGSGTYVMPP